MKRRKKSLLLIVLVLAMMCLTACGSSPSHTRVNDVSEPFETEITTAETKATTSETKQPLKTEETTVETVPLETEAVTEEVKPQYGNLKIQSVDGITLDGNPELPCKVVIHPEATDAVNNPLKINVESEDKKGKISFSFTSNDSSKLNCITKAIIMENNKDISYTRSSVSYIGDIATFSLTLPSNLENATTAIYELSYKNGDDYYDGYIAFAFNIQ